MSKKYHSKTIKSGLVGDTKVVIKSIYGAVQITTLENMYHRFHSGETINILSYNELTEQNEWKPVIQCKKSDNKVKNLKELYLINPEKSIIGTPDTYVYTKVIKGIQKAVINDYRYTSNFSIEETDKEYTLQTLYIFNDFDKNGKTFYVIESANLFTANLGYLNILDLKPNEDVVFYHDCYLSTFNSKTVSISEVVDDEYVFKISVEENRNFYANGVLVKQK